MKEFKYKYKTLISYIQESPNKYVDLLIKFKEMKMLANTKIYSQIKEDTTIFSFQYNRYWMNTIGGILIRDNIYRKTLRYNAMHYHSIPFEALCNKYRHYRRPISSYKRR